MFAFSRRSSFGLSVPTWLSNPGPVLLKRHVKTSTCERLVDEVELVHATPSYAHVRLQDGREQGRPSADATDAAALGPAPLRAPRHGVWVDYSFFQTHLALENSVETPYKFHC